MDLNPLRNHYLIAVKRPGYWLMSALGVLFLVALSLWFSYERGRYAGGFDSVAAAEKVSNLEQSLIELRNEMAGMQTSNTALERNNHIEKDASRQVKETILKLQDEILRLNEEVTFYRSIVSPQETKRRLYIQDLLFVRKGASEYEYTIVVTQRGNNHQVVRGTMRVTFDGLKNGQPAKSLDLGDLIVPKENNKFKLGFKYFQRFQGTVIIPEGFTPSALRIQVVPNSSRLVSIDKVVDWATVSSEGEKVNVGE